jgi:hypothetical protein
MCKTSEDFPKRNENVGECLEDDAAEHDSSNCQVDPTSILPSTSAHTTRQSPPSPSSAVPSPTHMPPRSGQGSQQQPLDSQQGQRLPAPHTQPGQTSKNSDDSTFSEVDEEDTAHLTDEPQDQIADFDWKDLEVRYNLKMDDIAERERAIYAEFTQMCNVCFSRLMTLQILTFGQFFGVWASTSQTHEVDRSFKRCV